MSFELSEDMYREQIMDHFKNPRNHGELKNADVTHKESNPLCGDKMQMMLSIKDGKIQDLRFSGSGCAISQASASMLTEIVKGKSVNEIKEMTKEDIFEMVGIHLSVMRVKCAMLSLDTLKNAIKIHEKYGVK